MKRKKAFWQVAKITIIFVFTLFIVADFRLCYAGADENTESDEPAAIQAFEINDHKVEEPAAVEAFHASEYRIKEPQYQAKNDEDLPAIEAFQMAVKTENDDCLWIDKNAYMKVYDYIETMHKVEHKDLSMCLSDQGFYQMTANQGESPFHILQITDVHVTGSNEYYRKDILALDAVYSMIQRTHPDFIVMTGDVIFGTDQTEIADGSRALNVVANMMDRIGIPWSWTFGNHDHSFFDRFTQEEIGQMLKQSTTLCMYQKDDAITGYTNGTFLFMNKEQKPLMACILMDSNSYLYDKNDGNSEYDYIRDDQTQWYVNQIDKLNDIYKRNIESMLFIHIPLQEYRVAWDMAMKHDSNVKVLFGTRREKECSSKHTSQLFCKIVEKGTTKAIFCGHDHVNDYGVNYKGVDLIYGKSIDYIAYPGIEHMTKQRGATLIEINMNGDYHIEPLQLKEDE